MLQGGSTNNPCCPPPAADAGGGGTGALNLAAILETAADVAKAMVHMHVANVLHSDLKVSSA